MASTQKKIFNYYKELPSWGKGIVIIGGLAVTYIFASQIISKIKEDAERRKQEKEQQGLDADFNHLLSQGVKPSFSENQALIYSSTIVDACNGCGTDMNKIKEVFKNVKNDADFLFLTKKFGSRQKERCPFSDDPRESFWSNLTPKMTLSAFLNSDLSSSNLKDINKILESNNVSYKF